MRAMMPAVMMIDDPFPIPRSVICSPSHITKQEPPVIVRIVIRRKPHPGSITIPDDPDLHLLDADRHAERLSDGDRDGQVSRVLGDPVPVRSAPRP
jgi:hypothetical protein